MYNVHMEKVAISVLINVLWHLRIQTYQVCFRHAETHPSACNYMMLKLSQHQHVTLSKACLEDFSRHVSRFPDVVRFSVDDADLDPEALPLGFTGPLQPLKKHPVIRSKQDDFSSDEVG